MSVVGVKLGPQSISDRRPFVPQQPTCGDCNDMSVLCQTRTSSPLFDHLVSTGSQRGRDFEAERLGRFQIDDQFKLGRLLHR